MCGLIGAEELALASIVTATGEDLSSAWVALAETVNSAQLRHAAEINLINDLTSTSSDVFRIVMSQSFLPVGWSRSKEPGVFTAIRADADRL